MPTFRSYTNAPGSHGHRHVPYASTGNLTNLSPKEKEARRQQKLAASCGVGGAGGASAMGGLGGLGSYGAGGGYGGSPLTVLSSTGNFFSVQLSTDFLELPQSIREQREIFRHFYKADPLVGQAIDLHTEIPLSKVKLAAPRPTTCPPGFDDPHDYGKYILDFFMRMCDRVKLFQRLLTMVHHYWLDGNCCIFAEDGDVEVPVDVGHTRRKEKLSYLDDQGTPIVEDRESWEEKPDREDREFKYYQKHYKGWDRLIILPIDQVQITSYTFSDKARFELIPSSRDRELVERARNGDEIAQEIVTDMPPEVRDHLENGRNIPLGTDPDEGSFVYHLVGRKSADEEFGNSILLRCIRVLYYRDKLRQAQTQIASRAMTPKRIVWAEGLSDEDTDILREQVDLSLVDPDYSIVTNYEVHWEEMGSRDRLLDLSSEYEITEKQLLSGLGVTEGLMSGETFYSGDRLKLEVINTRYLLLREMLQEYVEEYLFKPVARRKGFVEKDKWGNEVVLCPKLSFTRLPLRDSQDTYDALFNLYQKGSISIDVILELFGLDPQDTREKIEADMFTVNDALFNEILRSLYGEVGRTLAEKTDLAERLAKYLKVKFEAGGGEESGGRF